jgi:hypothetical protein
MRLIAPQSTLAGARRFRGVDVAPVHLGWGASIQPGMKDSGGQKWSS